MNKSSRFLLIWLASSFVGSIIFGQSVEILFQVNMNYRIDQGMFNPSFQFVDVAGSFNGWDGTEHRLSDSNQDGIYERVIPGFIIGESIEFKFRIDGKWDGREEFPGGGPNRSYLVVDTENVIDVWYNNEIPPGEGFQADFTASTRSFYSGGVVEFVNTTAGEFQETTWHIEGGKPSVSMQDRPKIYYDRPGLYDVTLIVSDGQFSDTIVRPDYIEVKERNLSNHSWWNEAVFYEIFVRSFQDSDGDGIGDIQGLIDRLDYLNDGDPETSEDLGITGIWLMPVNPSPSYHGYDVTNYFDVNSDYGSLDDFKRLVSEAHQRGIRIIVDFVMNHTSRDHPWFVESSQGASAARRNWYRWEGLKPAQTGPWGQNVWHQHPTGFYYGLFWDGMPDLNYNEPAVTEVMLEAAEFWLNDVGIDGFRLDAVKYIIEEDDVLEDSEETILFWQLYQDAVKQMKNDAFSVGEAWTSTNRVLLYVDNDGLDMCFEFDLAGSIIRSVNGQNASEVSKQIQEVYNLYPHLQYGTFLTNHDMNRVFNELDASFEKNKTAAAIYLTLPGTPFLYYGEEIGMRGLKPDEFIRRPMQWTTGSGAGFTTGSPWIALNSDYPTVNVSNQQNQSGSLWRFYNQMIHLRNDNKALSIGAYLPVLFEDSRILGFKRKHDDSEVMVFINLSDQSISGTGFDLSIAGYLPGDNRFTNLMTGEDRTFFVTDQGKSSIDIASREIIVLDLLKSTSVIDPTMSTLDLTVSPNPVSNKLILSSQVSTSKEDTFRIIDINGRIRASGDIPQNHCWDVSTIESGIYFLQIINDRSIHSASFIIEKH